MENGWIFQLKTIKRHFYSQLEDLHPCSWYAPLKNCLSMQIVRGWKILRYSSLGQLLTGKQFINRLNHLDRGDRKCREFTESQEDWLRWLRHRRPPPRAEWTGTRFWQILFNYFQDVQPAPTLRHYLNYKLPVYRNSPLPLKKLTYLTKLCSVEWSNYKL